MFPTHDPVALTRRINPYSTQMHHKHMPMHILSDRLEGR